MKRIVALFSVLLVILLLFAGCSQMSVPDLPVEEELRQIVPQMLDFGEDFYHRIEEIPDFMESRIAGIDPVFQLDETKWEKDSGESGGDTYYKPRGSEESREEWLVVADDYVLYSSPELSLFYTPDDAGEMRLATADFLQDEAVYFDDDQWTYSFAYEETTVSMTFWTSGELSYIWIFPDDGSYTLSYDPDLPNAPFSYSAEVTEEDGTRHDYSADYAQDFTLTEIFYTVYVSGTFLNDEFYYARYDGDYQLLDTDIPENAEPVTTPEPARTDEPDESPEPDQTPVPTDPPEKGNGILDAFLQNDPEFWKKLRELF